MGEYDEQFVFEVGYNKGFKDGIKDSIPKADYETRLKADMAAMLEDLKKEMNPIKECEYQIYGKEHWNFAGNAKMLFNKKLML